MESAQILRMKEDHSSTAEDFLELSSEQRLAILSLLYGGKSKVSVIAKQLGATVPEVFRNFERLSKANMIEKDTEGDYHLTSYGKIMLMQIPSLRFLSGNKKYFKNHDFIDIPAKFLQRIGSLEGGVHVKGFVKVLEYWKEIYQNADKYIYNILYEVPYTLDLVEPLVKKVNQGVMVRSIFSDDAIVPKERKQVIAKLGFKKLIDEGKIERRMKSNVKTLVVLNDKEACVMFPSSDGQVDLSEMFFGKDPLFYEWCMDYFGYCWEQSRPFQESKLKKD
jgi:predicted transcriptional regulator